MPYRGTYKPDSDDSFKMSRSGIESFVQCKRCFYLDRRLGISQPSGYPFSLNSAVDHLLKKEFDLHRAKGEAHPLMKAYGIDAIPFSHPDLDVWRANFEGVQYLHKKTNLYITGAVDDVWVTPSTSKFPNGELIVVDYKATSKAEEVTIDADWQMGYKRQMEVYQWLLRKNGFKVSDTGYFVYCNGRKDEKAFDGKLEFDVKVIPYKGDDGWIEGVLGEIKDCLEGGASGEDVPEYTEGCEWCRYQKEVLELG
jgi:CRISPR/Cas system-associated exonuclease Cas4 (RecB family)